MGAATHTDFTVVLWRDLETAPLSEWAERCSRLMEAIRTASPVRRFLVYDDRRVAHDVPVEPSALADLIASKIPTDSPGLGTSLDLICTDGSDPERSWHWRLGMGVGLIATEPGLGGNNVGLELDTGTAPDLARRLMGASVCAWSPVWACVRSRENSSIRREQDQPKAGWPPPRLDRMLHWCTYFGPERARALEFAKVRGRPDLALQPLHEGVELVLGETWESDESLLARQREIEPLLFAADSVAKRIARRFGHS